jgi:hypothetical protein
MVASALLVIQPLTESRSERGMIQLTRRGLEGSADLTELQRRFELSHVFRIPGLLHRDLMRLVSGRLDSCNWMTRDHGEIGREVTPDDPAAAGVLNFATNAP